LIFKQPRNFHGGHEFRETYYPTSFMNHHSLPPEDPWESDPVWQLLEQAPPPAAGARFVEDTVRMARLTEEIKPWWRRLLAPLPLVGMTAAAAAAVFAFTLISQVGSEKISSPLLAALDSPEAIAIQDIAETETLLAAVDQLDDFSDNDLVGLIGF
jgi:hypothetical protein